MLALRGPCSGTSTDWYQRLEQDGRCHSGHRPSPSILSIRLAQPCAPAASRSRLASSITFWAMCCGTS